MSKIEFENGSIIEPIGDAGQGIRGEIRCTYIDIEEKKPLFEGYRPSYYFKNAYENLTDIQIKDVLSKAILTGKDKFASCDSISKPITLDDLEKWAEKLNQLPPNPNEIEIGYFALQVLLDKIPTTQDIKNINMMYGVPVIIVEGGDLNFNQMKVKYSDGNSKVIDVFKWNDNINFYDSK